MSKKWNSRIQFPTDSNFTCRIIGAEFGPSNSSKNPMITLEWEVVQPEEVEVGNDKYVIAGVKSKTYHVTQVINENDPAEAEEKTASVRSYLTDPNEGLFPKLGIDPTTVDWDNIDTKQFLGKLVLCMMAPDIVEQRSNPTAEQIATAKRTGKRAEGNILKNPLTGQALVNYFPKIREIFGLAPQDGMKMAY